MAITLPAAQPGRKRRFVRFSGPRWKLYVLVGLAGPAVVMSAILGYYYVVFSRMIDARIHGEMQRVDPRVFARPFEVRKGQSVSQLQLIERLNELGYAQRERAQQAGEFTIGRDAVVLIPRDGDRKGATVRVVFGTRSAKTKEPTAVSQIEVVGSKTRPDRLTLDAPLITALITGGREKRRDVPLQMIPQRMVQAVLADRGPALLRSSGRRSDWNDSRRFHEPLRRQEALSSAAARSRSRSSRTPS
jgi:hypothetical protein